MVIFPLAPDQTIAQMWSNGARGGAGRWQVDNLRHCRLCLAPPFMATKLFYLLYRNILLWSSQLWCGCTYIKFRFQN